MSSKTKLAISISAIALIIVAAVVAVAVVFASRNAKINSGFTGSYTATHVDAEITGSYIVGGTIGENEDSWVKLQTSSGDTITFTSDMTTGSEATSQSFNAISVTLTSTNDHVIFKYVISNTSSTDAFTITGTISGTYTNLDVAYQTSGDVTTSETALVTDGTISNDGAISLGQLNAEETVTIYITVSINDIDENATLNGSIDWELAVAD